MELLVEDSNNAYGVHPALWRWTPDVDGPAFTHFLETDGLPESARENLRSFTPRVLGQTKDPSADGRTTGLVIGKVQSGKTNSFLSLAALASDNDFRLIIILSGTKNILKDQTYKQVLSRTRNRRDWKAVDFDPEIDQHDFEARLRAAMSRFSPKTLVVTILKRTRTGSATAAPQGIARLADFFRNSEFSGQVAHQPVLIVDDEADEASLDNTANARRQGRAARPSPTHDAIERLRQCFNRHVLVQYTATPQANLLVELNNQLAPDFCELLEPGNGYCGAIEFFPDDRRYFREIPASDLAAVAAGTLDPPETLSDAMRHFYVAAAFEDWAGGEGEQGARTMLVHPERLVASHTQAARWVRSIHTLLLDLANAAIEDPTSHMAQAFAAEVDVALADLGRTIALSGVRPQDLFEGLRERLAETAIRTINSDRQHPQDIDWDEELCWIFIGGDVLQRGFAMQGLTTTWMSRQAGGGQVDVLMQRGRWFGYRQSFLPYCRLWMPAAVHDDYYALFADHEEALWRSLREHLADGKGLAEWSRIFWLDPSPALQLCRRSTQWFRLRDQPEWAQQEWIPREGDDAGVAAAAANAQLVAELLGKTSAWAPAWRPQGPPQTGSESREHLFALTSVAVLLDFMNSYRFFGENIVDQAVLCDAMKVLLKRDASATAALVNMRPAARTYRRGQQTDKPKINRLLAGASTGALPSSHPRYYPGDRAFHGQAEGLPAVVDELFTLQIHRPRITRTSDGSVLTDLGNYLEGGCPLVAAYLPSEVRKYRREGPGDRR